MGINKFQSQLTYLSDAEDCNDSLLIITLLSSSFVAEFAITLGTVVNGLPKISQTLTITSGCLLETTTPSSGRVIQINVSYLFVPNVFNAERRLTTPFGVWTDRLDKI